MAAITNFNDLKSAILQDFPLASTVVPTSSWTQMQTVFNDLATASGYPTTALAFTIKYDSSTTYLFIGMYPSNLYLEQKLDGTYSSASYSLGFFPDGKEATYKCTTYKGYSTSDWSALSGLTNKFVGAGNFYPSSGIQKIVNYGNVRTGYERLDKLMNDIADAIRTRRGMSGPIKAQEFSKKIRAIDVTLNLADRATFDAFILDKTGCTLENNALYTPLQSIFSNTTDYPNYWMVFIRDDISKMSSNKRYGILFLFYVGSNNLGETFDETLIQIGPSITGGTAFTNNTGKQLMYMSIYTSTQDPTSKVFSGITGAVELQYMTTAPALEVIGFNNVKY